MNSPWPKLMLLSLMCVLLVVAGCCTTGACGAKACPKACGCCTASGTCPAASAATCDQKADCTKACPAAAATCCGK